MSEQVDQLHRLLRSHDQTVAVAESLTGGMLSAALTDLAGSSAAFRGGLVVYATDLKASLAGVSETLLERRGAVDAEVALELARGVRARLSSSWGVGVTGVAGPDPQDGQAVGTVFLAVVGPRTGNEKMSELHLEGDRNIIRVQTVGASVALLIDAIQDGYGPIAISRE